MDFLLAIAALVAIVWLAGFTLSGQILWGCAAFLFATCCLGYDYLRFNIGMEFTLDRLWMIVLVAIAIVQRKLGHADPKPWTKLEWTLAGFIVLLGLHVLLQENPTEPRLSGSPWWHLVVGYVFPACLYFIARQSVLSERRVEGFWVFLVVFGIYLGFTGVMEMTKQWWAVWPRYIADPLAGSGLHFGRARGPMIQSVSYGFYCSVCLCAACLCFLRWGWRGKLLAFPAACLLLAAAVLTHTRSVWMGTALVGALLVWYCLRDPLRKFLIGMAVVGGLCLVILKFDSLVGFQREGTVEDTKTSAECRTAFAVVSWQMFLDRPIFGFGFGNFPEAKFEYLDSLRDYDMVMELIRPLIHHNTYLDILTELGAVGLALYLGIMIGWGRRAWQLIHQSRYPTWSRNQGILTLACLGSYAIQMMFHEVTFTSIDNSLMYLLAGITAGLTNPSPPSTRHDVGRERDEAVLRDWIGTETPAIQPPRRRASDALN